MKPSDISPCARIIGKTELFQKYGFTEAAAKKTLQSALRDPQADVVVARASKTVLGFAWFVRNGAFHRSPYLRLIAVAPATAGRGVGKALLDEMESRYLNPSGIFLLVTETNSGARRFYRKRGYRKVGAIPDFVKKGMTECIYFKAPCPLKVR